MKKSLIIKISALALCLIFFMPFFLVSCNNISISITGPVMAFGDSTRDIEGTPVMLLLLILPACVAAISFLKQYNKFPEVTRFENIAAIISAAVSMLLPFWYYSGLRQYIKGTPYINLEVKIGFYLTVIIDIAVIGVIIYDKVAQNSSIIPSLSEGNIEKSPGFCENCRKELNGDEEFCGECGVKVTSRQSQDNNTKPAKKFELPRIVLPVIKLPKIKWTKQKKIAAGSVSGFVIVIIVLAAVGGSLSSRERAISKFYNALASKDVKKISKLIRSSDPRIQINETTVKPLVDYIDKNPSWLKNEMDSIESQSRNLDSKSKAPKTNSMDNSFSNIDGNILLKDNGKKFIFFNSYNFEIKPYFIKISTNMKDAKILINDKEVYTAGIQDFSKELGPYLPGIYYIQSIYEGQYVKLENKQEISLMGNYKYASSAVKNVDLSLSARYVDVQCDFEDAKLYANGKDTGVLIKDAGKFGPVDSSVKLKAVKDFPWGTVNSDEVQVGDSWQVDIAMVPSDEELIKNIMDTVVKFNNSRQQALISRDSSKITDATASLIESEKNYIDNMISNDKYHTGKLTKIIFDLDSIKIINKDEKYYLTISSSEFYDSADYYKDEKDVKTSTEHNMNEIYLTYDESGKKWLIDSSMNLYSIGTKNLKEMTFN